MKYKVIPSIETDEATGDQTEVTTHRLALERGGMVVTITVKGDPEDIDSAAVESLKQVGRKIERGQQVDFIDDKERAA